MSETLNPHVIGGQRSCSWPILDNLMSIIFNTKLWCKFWADRPGTWSLAVSSCVEETFCRARLETSGPTHHGTAAAAAAAPCCCSSARKGARCRLGVRRAPAASLAPPGRLLCPLYGVAGPRQGWAGGPGLYWNLEWHQCCGRAPLQRCPHLSPSRGSCWARGSCRPPCSWYPVINASERPGTAIRQKGFSVSEGLNAQEWVRDYLVTLNNHPLST